MDSNICWRLLNCYLGPWSKSTREPRLDTNPFIISGTIFFTPLWVEDVFTMQVSMQDGQFYKSPWVDYRDVAPNVGPSSIVVSEAAVALGLGSNSGEDMDVCKCIGPLRHGGTLNSRRAASPFVRLVEEEERWEALTTPMCSSSKLGWN
ncbi:hypothetical protein TNCV_527101 [Trichonephila clavipes]|nr:hypothetical protein TNCV_527101 [Trichonephila clavipes]